MSPRRTAQFPHTHRNGLEPLFDSPQVTSLRSIPALHSASPRVAVGMGMLLTQGRIFSARRALARWKNGLMTIVSCVTCPSRCGTWLQHRLDPSRILVTPTISLTLTASLVSSEFPGRWTRTTPSRTSSPSQVLSGISFDAPSPWDRRKRPNISSLFRRGRARLLTTSTTSRASTANSFMRVLSSQRDVRTSRAWKPCLASSTIVLSCLVPLPTPLQQTSNGGQQPSSSPPFIVRSPAPSTSSTLVPILTLVQASGSGLSSEIIGGRGRSFPAGNPTSATSAGQRLLASSSSFALSLPWAPSEGIPKYSETTTASSKVGGITAAAIAKSTPSFGGSTSYSNLTTASFTRATLPARATQLTLSPAENFRPALSSCPDFPSLLN
ncbi:hypothetical protein C8R46DRAFT_952161, partial [Mycena filopes]